MRDQRTDRTGQKHTAGLFDIRNIIGALLAIYGVVVLVTGLAGTSQKEIDRADGVNANIWTGIALLVIGVLFLLWARRRPVVVDEEELARDEEAVDDAAGRDTHQ